ncbi:MAG: TolC family protein, partial [Cyanobacteriota bacterium]|nr:TolC family protein [Cyanobacteriota bacterium]
MNCSRSAFALSLISAFAIFAPFSAVAEESDLPDAMQIEAVSSTWPVGDAPLVPPIPPATLQRLDMDTAVQLAQERNPIIQEKYQSFRASQDELGSDFATWWPTISFDFNFGNYNQNSYYNYAGANSGIDTSIYSDYTGGSTSLSDLPSYLFARDYTSSYLQGVQTLDVNWKLYDPARGPQIWKGKYLVKEAGSDYIIARRDYSLMTRQAYVKLQRTLASIVTGRQLVDNDRLLLQLADSRKRLGVASQLDVAKQITVLRTDEVNLVNAKRDSLVAQAELAQLLNDPRSMEIQPSEALSPLGSWASSLQETIDSALEYRQVIVKNLSRVK